MSEQKQVHYHIPVYRVQLVKDSNFTSNTKKISRPQDAYSILQGYMQGLDRENFVVLLLDTKNQVIGLNTVSIGTLNTSLVHPREVFKPAILASAAALILAHNHPSGDPTPSREDIEVTSRLLEAGKIIGIEVLDHIIVGDRCLSLKEQGYI